MPDVRIDFDPAQARRWDEFLSRAGKSSLLHSPAYAAALKKIRAQDTRLGVIFADGAEAGFCCVQQATLARLFHFTFLDRGPLWFGPPNGETAAAFFSEFNRLFPRGFFRRRRVIPEIDDTPENRRLMQAAGFERKADGYRSIWLDLAPPLETLRANLKQKWRAGLNAAGRGDIALMEDAAGATLDGFLRDYAADRLKKRYHGPSPELLGALARAADRKDRLLLWASSADRPCAAVLVFCHGRSATYQAGFSDDAGRKAHAHNALLWRAVETLKARGIDWLDLGGVPAAGGEGLARFKDGLGGRVFTLAGIYR